MSSKARRAPTSETQLVESALTWLRAQGGWWEKRWGGSYVAPGIPDIIGCFHGRYIAIECKAPGVYSTPGVGLTIAQSFVLERIRQAGGFTLVVDDLGALMDAFSAFKVCLNGRS